MLRTIEGKPFTDLDEFVCDNPGVGFVLVCDRTGETLEIPGDKAECFYETTYTQDTYCDWLTSSPP